MQRRIFLIAAALALQSCAEPRQPPPAAPAASASAAFPDLRQTPFRANAVMQASGGASTPVTLLSQGSKIRLEMASPEGVLIRVLDQETSDALVWRRHMGRITPLDGAEAEAAAADVPDFWWWHQIATAGPSRTGPCALIGESGFEWAIQRESGPSSLCITSDGIVLWAAKGGATVWRLTSLQRGPQPESEFERPAAAIVAEEAEPRDLNAAYVPPPQFSTAPDTRAPQN